MSLMITESTPSFHSLVLVFMQPNNSSDVTAFGSTISQAVIHFLCVSESDKFFQTADLAVPGTPIKKQEWRTSRISASCTHFRTKPSSGYRFLLFATSAQSSLSFSSVFASALIPGNKSLIRPKKIPCLLQLAQLWRLQLAWEKRISSSTKLNQSSTHSVTWFLLTNHQLITCNFWRSSSEKCSPKGDKTVLASQPYLRWTWIRPRW